MSKLQPDSRLGRLLLALLPHVLVAWVRSLRLRRDPEPWPGPRIYALWHNRLLVLAGLYRRQGITVLVSPSRDGEVIARVLSRLGYGLVRGSSARGGAEAVAGLCRVLAEGGVVSITPDGPRGPRYVAKEGVAALAAASGVPVVPGAWASGRGWVAGSWDLTRIPAPFSRCRLRLGEPIHVPRSADLAEATAKIEAALRRVTALAEADCGLGPRLRAAERLRRGAWGSPAASVMLAPLSALWRAAARVRRAAWDKGLLPSRRAPMPVVSVGSIRAGGAGKTPLAAWLLEELARMGARPCLLSRGFGGGRLSEPVRVGPGSDPAVVGDEPVLLARTRPEAAVYVCRRRAEAAALAAAEGATVAVLDDGMQHLSLRRDLEVVVLPARDPLGGRVLPAGPLREGPEAVRRAHCVVLLCEGGEPLPPDEVLEEVRRAAGGAHVAVFVREAAGAFGAGGDVLEVAGRRCLLVCALGRPEGFRRACEGLGAVVVGEMFYGDHHLYTRLDIDDINFKATLCEADCVLVTEKDAVKLERLIEAGERLWTPLGVVRSRLRPVAGEEGLRALLASCLLP